MDPITAIANAIPAIADFTTNYFGIGYQREALSQGNSLIAGKQSELTELEREELKAKQTTVLIYSIIGVIVLIILIVLGIKVFKGNGAS